MFRINIIEALKKINVLTSYVYQVNLLDFYFEYVSIIDVKEYQFYFIF